MENIDMELFARLSEYYIPSETMAGFNVLYIMGRKKINGQNVIFG
jgi:hypothetical protein